MVAHTYHPSYLGDEGGRIARSAWAKSGRDYLKNENINKKAGGVAQAVEWLPGKCKALTSVPSTTTNNKQTKTFV
jgi:hypothetical protein